MVRFARYLVPFAAAAMLAACGVQESYKTSGAEVEQFRAAMSAGQYEQIWDRAAPELHKATDKARFTALLDAVGRKLGKVTDAKQTNWSGNNHNGVSTVTMTFDTTFEHGSGKETITFLWVSDDSLKLRDYAIDSPDMMIR
jgi:Protein of unknown function (DUF4019)